MPLPKRNKGEKSKDFLSRCMGNPTMNKDFPDQKQRYAVCVSQSKRSDEADEEEGIRFIVRDEKGYERIVFAEVLIPDSLNVYGDFHTRRSVQEFAYGFMMNGFGIDVEHDNNDVSSSVYVIESFIAREGDRDFIPGSWVVGLHIANDEVWQKVVNGELNGFSYEALVRGLKVYLTAPDERIKYGLTQPDLVDGHVHQFYVVLDDNDRPVLGGTLVTNGHSHTISSHTFTDSSFSHLHLYSYVESLEVSDDEAP